MESEGRRALRFPLLSKIFPFSFPQKGIVCAGSQGKILGVINFFDFHLNGEPCTLLANVCVDPDHRCEGIASRMLSEAERILDREGIRDLFLQARVEMKDTIDFYRKRGFRVTDYRENRILPSGSFPVKEDPDFRLEQVPGADLKTFSELMKSCYPQTVLWNLNYRPDLFSTELLTKVMIFLESPVNRFRRAVSADGKIMAWAAWQKLSGFADQMWVIPSEGLTDAEYSRTLKFLCSGYKGKKPLKIDVPVGRPAEVYVSAGLILQQTLAWMWKRL